MASVALDPAYRRVSVEEFLAMDFGGARAELDDGLIYMMAGGSEEHARIAANIIMYLGPRLRGSGCRPYGSDYATRTGRRTVRLPDVSIYCGNPARAENRRKQLLGDPRVVFEVLSRSTSLLDERVKVPEYQALPGVAEIVVIDPDAGRVRLLRREGGGWAEHRLGPGDELHLASLGVAMTQAEIFAAD